MAEGIVGLSWRRRAELMQNQAMDCMILRHVVAETDRDLNRGYSRAYGVSPGDPGVSKEYLPLGRVATNLWSDNENLIERLFMHECRIESNLLRTMRELRKYQTMRRTEHDAAAKRKAAGAGERQSPPERRPAQDRSGNLVKQSQFAPALMGTMSCMAKDYDDNPPVGKCENKANRTEIRKPIAAATKDATKKTGRAG